MSGVEAELLEDRGAACAGQEFFRSGPFCEAEGVTHTLRLSSAATELLAPLIVRDVTGSSLRDAVSPYGYPGLAGSAARSAIDPAATDFSPTGLLSIFLRHGLGRPPPLAGAQPLNTVQIADPGLPRKSRMSDRQQIRRNRRRGIDVELVAGPASSSEQRAGFLAAYEQTMHRTGAAERYLFGGPYFDRILASEQTWLGLAVAPGGEVAAGSVAVRSDGMVHYFLSGTADRFLPDSPMKSVVAALIDHSWGLGLPLNMGGGIRAGDRLEEFKRGFGNREEPWHASEIVCDAAEYDRLTAGRSAQEGFFPAYRAP